MNPLKFSYGQYSSTIFNNSTKAKLSSHYENQILVRGKFDYINNSESFLCIPDEDPYWYEMPKTDCYFFDSKYQSNQHIYLYKKLSNGTISPIDSILIGEGFRDIFCADLDGTQEESIVKVNNTENETEETLIFDVFTTAKSGLTKRYSRKYKLNTVNSMKGVTSIQPKFYFASDFDGDGKMEIFAISAHKHFGKKSLGSRCYIFDLESDEMQDIGAEIEYVHEFFGTKQRDPEEVKKKTDKLFVIDYDGDGKSDICHIDGNGTYIYTFNRESSGKFSMALVATYPALKRSNLEKREIFAYDMNGDGISDFAVSPELSETNPKWTYHYGRGDGTFEKITLGAWEPMYNKGDYFFIQDVNSDGLGDLVRCNSSVAQVFINSNGAFVDTPSAGILLSSGGVSDSYARVAPVSMTTRNSFTKLLVYDSKGNVDLYGTAENASLEALCKSMTNSLGVKETNSYKLASDQNSSICRPGSGAVYPYVNINEDIPVLSGVSTSVDGLELLSEDYQYNNPVYHRQGLGFLGFQIISKTNTRGESYLQAFDVKSYGMMVQDMTPREVTTYKYAIIANGDGTKRVAPNLITVSDKADMTTLQVKIEYDQYGNTTFKEVSYGNGLYDRETYEYINNDVLAHGYMLGLMKKRTVMYQSQTKTHTIVETYPSYDRGLPTEKLTSCGGQPVKSEMYEYYANGLLKLVTEKQYSSSKELKTSHVYDSRNRLSKTTDYMGFVTDYTYFPENGLVKSVKDKAGETLYAYDAFGREKSRRDPVNPEISTSYSWPSGTSSGYCLTVKTNGVPVETHYDALNREVRRVEMRVDGKKSAVDTEYDIFGNVASVSLPYINGSAPAQKIEYEYDSFGRKLSETFPSGKKNSYTYGRLTATETVNEVQTVKTLDFRGNVIKVTDPSGSVEYELGADGQPEKITANGDITTTFVYDAFRRLISRTDPSFGTESYTYDASGNIKTKTDAIGQTTTYEYDGFNRVTSINMPEMTVTNTYDAASGYLTSVTSSNGFFRTNTYDAPGRIVESVESFDGHTLTARNTYNNDKLSKAVYISDRGFTVSESYSYTGGKLSSIVMNDSVQIYQVIGMNALGQVTEKSSGGMKTSFTYDEYGSLTGRRDTWGNAVINDVSLDFDPYTGNLLSRTDNLRNLIEQFDYDGLNRLIGYGDNTLWYADNGNIVAKSDAGIFGYTEPTKPYALTAAVFADGTLPTREQNITYTSFMRPSVLSEDERTATFTYGPEFNRIKLRHERKSQYRSQCFYLGGNYEFENVSLMQLAEKEEPSEPVPAEPVLPGIFDTNGVSITDKPGSGDFQDMKQTMYDVERIYLGGDAYTAPAVLVKNTLGRGSRKLYYIVRDHVGSIVALVEADGGKVASGLSYDAWGRLRDPQTHEVYAPGKEPALILGRGYGSHEYLYDFGLVNMNARLYDPVVGRFLSPDPYVQDPGMPQNFNRYSYCLNNPLLYKDPSGELFFIDDFIFGFWKGVFKGKNPLKMGWKSIRNSFNIWNGLYSLDTNKGWGMIGEFLSRFTWQLPQTIGGFFYGHALNMAGRVKDVESKYGVTVIQTYTMKNAVTIGNFIVGQPDLEPDPNNSTFQHEYGHYIQSQKLGPLYLLMVGIPSAINVKWGKDHEYQPYEIGANWHAYRYFSSLGINFKWDTLKNPFSKP